MQDLISGAQRSSGQLLKQQTPLHQKRSLSEANREALRLLGEPTWASEDSCGNVLRRLRITHNIDPVALATHACLTLSQLYQLESGQSSLFYSDTLRQQAARRVARLMGADWDSIAQGTYSTAKLHSLRSSPSTSPSEGILPDLISETARHPDLVSSLMTARKVSPLRLVETPPAPQVMADLQQAPDKATVTPTMQTWTQDTHHQERDVTVPVPRTPADDTVVMMATIPASSEDAMTERQQTQERQTPRASSRTLQWLGLTLLAGGGLGFAAVEWLGLDLQLPAALSALWSL